VPGDWVDQGEAILSSEKSIKTPVNSHYFFLGVKDDSSPGACFFAEPVKKKPGKRPA
jgi:hypothetical protein